MKHDGTSDRETFIVISTIKYVRSYIANEFCYIT